MKLNDIWCEKYRPKTLDDIVLSDAARAQLNSIANNKSIPHLLLQGPAGIGKCLDGGEVLEIFVSDSLYEKLNYFLENDRDI